MATTDITIAEFESTVSGDGIVFVDFWADWCGPCKSFAPIFEAAAEKHDDIQFAKVDTEAQQELAGALAIRSIPTLMIFRDGIQLFSQAGARSGVAASTDALAARTATGSKLAMRSATCST